MPKFRKRPVVVEAVQWFKDGDHPKVTRYSSHPHPTFVIDGNDKYGMKHVEAGDWIVTGISGCCYPVRPDVFERCYEKVEDSDNHKTT